MIDLRKPDFRQASDLLCPAILGPHYKNAVNRTVYEPLACHSYTEARKGIVLASNRYPSALPPLYVSLINFSPVGNQDQTILSKFMEQGL